MEQRLQAIFDSLLTVNPEILAVSIFRIRKDMTECAGVKSSHPERFILDYGTNTIPSHYTVVTLKLKTYIHIYIYMFLVFLACTSYSPMTSGLISG